MTVSTATYDLVLMLDAEIEDSTRAKIVADARAAIEAKGKLLRHDEWGSRALAYPIDRRTVAVYHLLQFHADSAELLSGLNRSLRITDGILRFRIIKLKPGVPEAPDMRATPAAGSSAALASADESPSSAGGADASGADSPPSGGDSPASASADQPAGADPGTSASADQPGGADPGASAVAGQTSGADPGASAGAGQTSGADPAASARGRGSAAVDPPTPIDADSSAAARAAETGGANVLEASEPV